MRRSRPRTLHRPASRVAGSRLVPLWLVGSLLAACREPSDAGDRRLGDDARPGPIFADATAECGLDFVHFNGMSGDFYYSEMMGAGAALLDYDGDGDLDLYLVQGRMVDPGKEPAAATVPPAPAMLPLGDRLYRNELTVGADGRGRLSFTDVTAGSGIGPGAPDGALGPGAPDGALGSGAPDGALGSGAPDGALGSGAPDGALGSGAPDGALEPVGYGMGVAAGDFDNDGWVDLYVTAAGPNRMLRNNGDGTFTDVTAASGTGDRRWGTSAAWLDFDRDGWLDLYLANYVDFTVATHQLCRSLTGAPDYCGPLAYRPQRDRLFRNRGDGSFEDVSVAARVASEIGAGLGVLSGDFDDDGWPDLYVANDGMPNLMWINRRDGTFTNRALVGGSALNLEGQAEAGMGVVAGDFDADGDEDLLVTHLALETNTLYRNDGAAFFDDRSVASGLGPPSWRYTGFGTAWIDYDNDGWLDLLAVNGGVKVLAELADRGDPHPLGMSNQLFRNLGAGAGPDGGPVAFQEMSEQAGPAFALAEVSRGLAIGDLDNDGDADAVLSNNGGPARLLINRVGQEASWLGLELRATSGRHLLGAWVAVHADGHPAGPLRRRVRTGGSYLSASDPRLLIGLGHGRRGLEIDRVVVRWPSGSTEVFSAEAERYNTLLEGTGERARAGGG